MIRFVSILLAVILAFAACSKSASPIFPDNDQDIANIPSTPELPDSDGGNENSATDIWAITDVVWNPVSGEISLNTREAEISARHFKVSCLLNPPKCDDCVSVINLGTDQELGLGKLAITLKNPSQFTGFDVRGLLRIKSQSSLSLLNTDGYTNLFQKDGYKNPSPFVLYAESESNHVFAPGVSHTETFELKTDNPSAPQDFTLIVTAGFPTPAGDVSSVSGFRQGGQFIKGGAGTKVSFMVDDLQNDVTGVKIITSELGAGDVWLSLANGRWEGYISNTSVNPGNYNLLVEAYSPNPQNAVTSNYYRAVVFYDYQSSRTQLLSLLNADRIAGGVQSVATDPYLDTVAQYHAQDMSAKHFFNHYNLDGWSPWQRMDYFGVSYGSAGENIAVGQDSASEVEIAWMNSAGHKANIMNDSFEKVGLGIAPIMSGDMYYPGYYWVQVFSD